MRNEAFREAWSSLSDIQRRAAEWEQGPMLLLAGPGSGKTRVLTCRIARLLEASADKNFRVLGLTFTNKAANEMKERLERYVPEQRERVFLGTFHSFCADVLRQHGAHLGIPPDFSIFSLESDLMQLLRDALRGEPAFQEEGGNGRPDPKDILGIIHRLKANLIFPDQADRAFRDPELGKRAAAAYAAYEKALRNHGALDFDSLILRTHQLFRDFPVFAELIQSVYPYVCVDEFQDTNMSQYRLISLSLRDGSTARAARSGSFRTAATANLTRFHLTPIGLKPVGKNARGPSCWAGFGGGNCRKRLLLFD
jgi:ATP-dependent DNA helicase UvrD/PcrA